MRHPSRTSLVRRKTRTSKGATCLRRRFHRAARLSAKGTEMRRLFERPQTLHSGDVERFASRPNAALETDLAARARSV